MPRIKVLGLKTQTLYELEYSEEEGQTYILNFLRSKGIAMSTACFGKGMCHRCYFNGDYMGCAYKLDDLKDENIEVIEIEYL